MSSFSLLSSLSSSYHSDSMANDDVTRITLSASEITSRPRVRGAHDTGIETKESLEMDVSYDSLITLILYIREQKEACWCGCHLRENAYASVHCLSYDVCFVVLSRSVFPTSTGEKRNLKDIITDNESYTRKRIHLTSFWLILPSDTGYPITEITRLRLPSTRVFRLDAFAHKIYSR